MSEYTEVEQPFLQQLQALGWETIDQGPDIPADPGKTLRLNFRQWILPEVFARSVAALNTTADGQLWMTDKQFQDLQDQILRQPNRTLLEAKVNLLSILRTSSVFMDTDGGPRIKVVCRYQQFRAANQIVERLRSGRTAEEKSEVVWHTQGSGKSLTMVFDRVSC